MSSRYTVWKKDDLGTRQLFLDGEPVVVKGSDYLGNDFIIEGLMELEVWKPLVSQEPKLGRIDVALDPQSLNAIWVIKELAGIGRVSETDKVLKDGRLMGLCSFNAEVIREKAFQGAPVVSQRTLYRHAERVPRAESEKMLLTLTQLSRQNKWLRGRVYAADCYEIQVSGKKMQGIYENTDKKTRRGYRLLTITNVTPKREQIVAAALGGICQDERVLLMRALQSLSCVCKPHEMIDLLLLDRGFWKAQLMWELANEWRIPFLTLAKQDLDLVKEVKRRVSEQGQVHWQELWRKRGHRGKPRRYQVQAVEDVFLDGYAPEGDGAGSVQCLLAYADSDIPEESPKELVYITSQPVKGREHQVVKRYGERWVIENECMKWLSEHDGRLINGWTLNAVQYRLYLLLALRNAMTLLDWKYPQDASRMRRLLAQRKRRAYLEGHGVVIYTQRGIFGTYPTEDGMKMAEERGSRRIIKRMKKEVKQLDLPGLGDRQHLLATLDEVAGNKREV